MSGIRINPKVSKPKPREDIERESECEADYEIVVPRKSVKKVPPKGKPAPAPPSPPPSPPPRTPSPDPSDIGEVSDTELPPAARATTPTPPPSPKKPPPKKILARPPLPPPEPVSEDDIDVQEITKEELDRYVMIRAKRLAEEMADEKAKKLFAEMQKNAPAQSNQIVPQVTPQTLPGTDWAKILGMVAPAVIPLVGLALKMSRPSASLPPSSVPPPQNDVSYGLPRF